MLNIHHIAKTFNPGTITEKRALVDVDLHLKEGDFVTVIGGNGAGKSTMLNAVAGVFPVDKGTIEIGGVDVTQLPEYKRAAYLGRVFQDPMTGTAATMNIEENMALAMRRGERRGLRWGISNMEREMYREQLHTLGLGLEDRMSSKVGLLSGGQRQRLSIARALMKRADLYIFDDSFSALDFKTDAALRRALVPKTRDAATLIIAQRISTILHADQIIVLKDGEMAGIGTHEELMETCEVYRAIAESQMKGGDGNGR